LFAVKQIGDFSHRLGIRFSAPGAPSSSAIPTVMNANMAVTITMSFTFGCFD